MGYCRYINWILQGIQSAAVRIKPSCPSGAVIVQCDRALVWNARGSGRGSRTEKLATTVSHRFLASLASPLPCGTFTPKSQHIALSPCRSGSGRPTVKQAKKTCKKTGVFGENNSRNPHKTSANSYQNSSNLDLNLWKTPHSNSNKTQLNLPRTAP
jgi:hypothetical protein